jgi:hypothetical protein
LKLEAGSTKWLRELQRPNALGSAHFVTPAKKFKPAIWRSQFLSCARGYMPAAHYATGLQQLHNVRHLAICLQLE